MLLRDRVRAGGGGRGGSVLLYMVECGCVVVGVGVNGALKLGVGLVSRQVAVVAQAARLEFKDAYSHLTRACTRHPTTNSTSR